MWKKYWPIYERFEKEVCELTFFVSLCDSHLSVYSLKTAELLLRLGAECENAAKALATDRNFNTSGEQIQDLNFPHLGDLLCRHVSFQNKSVKIIWYYQSLTHEIITPFDTWVSTGKSTNPKWYFAYNGVKHNRDTNFSQASFESILNGLAGLFILNLWLRKKDIEHGGEWIGLAKKRIESYSNFFTPEEFLKLQGGNTKRLVLSEP